MRYIEQPALSLLVANLNGLPVNDSCHLSVRIEVYNTKPVGEEKKLYKTLHEKLAKIAEDTLDSQTELGDFTDARMRKTLVQLILGMSPGEGGRERCHSRSLSSLTPLQHHHHHPQHYHPPLPPVLNAAHPDSDFSRVSATDFKKWTSLDYAASYMNENLAGILTPSLLNQVWSEVDKCIRLRDCDVFTYTGEEELGDDIEPTFWSNNIIALNLKDRSVLYFSAAALMTAVTASAAGISGGAAAAFGNSSEQGSQVPGCASPCDSYAGSGADDSRAGVCDTPITATQDTDASDTPMRDHTGRGTEGLPSAKLTPSILQGAKGPGRAAVDDDALDSFQLEPSAHALRADLSDSQNDDSE